MILKSRKAKGMQFYSMRCEKGLARRQRSASYAARHTLIGAIRLQQGMSFLKFHGVKAFGEPVIDFGQQLVRLIPVSLVLL